MIQPWKRIQPTKVQKVGWRTITTKTFKMPNGKHESFDLYDVEGRQFVAVVALTASKQAIIVREFCPGPELVMDQLPGGFVDPEDKGDAIVAATRELEEETGYTPAKITYLGKVYKDAYSNATWHFCLAEDCVRNEKGQQLDEIELAGVEVHLVSIDELIRAALQGRMTDPDAVLLAYEKLMHIQKEVA